LDKCELWRKQEVPPVFLSDIYDGTVWKSFMNYNGRLFLSEPYNLGLMLNCDWFQPYNQTQYTGFTVYIQNYNIICLVLKFLAINGFIFKALQYSSYGKSRHCRCQESIIFICIIVYH